MLINVKIVCSSSLCDLISLSLSLWLWVLSLSVSLGRHVVSLWGQMKVLPCCYLRCQHRYPHRRSPATQQMRFSSKQMHPHILTSVCPAAPHLSSGWRCWIMFLFLFLFLHMNQAKFQWKLFHECLLNWTLSLVVQIECFLAGLEKPRRMLTFQNIYFFIFKNAMKMYSWSISPPPLSHSLSLELSYFLILNLAAVKASTLWSNSDLNDKFSWLWKSKVSDGGSQNQVSQNATFPQRTVGRVCHGNVTLYIIFKVKGIKKKEACLRFPE